MLKVVADEGGVSNAESVVGVVSTRVAGSRTLGGGWLPKRFWSGMEVRYRLISSGIE
jgi:hypothetical protein